MPLRTVIALTLLFASLVASSVRRPEGTVVLGEEAFTPNVGLVTALGKSHLSLVADFAWIKAISVSTRLSQPADGLALIAWCRFVGDLDPQFVWAYMMGGLLGAVTVGTETYNAQEAAALLATGMERVPGDHRLPVYLAFNQLHLQGDAGAAGRTLMAGSRIPNAPPFMAALATRLLTQSDDFDSALDFARTLATEGDPGERAFFERRALEIVRDRAVAEVQAAVDRYRAQRGTLPATVLQLSFEGFLPEVPSDPLGGELRIDEAGVVYSTSGTRLKAFIPTE